MISLQTIPAINQTILTSSLVDLICFNLWVQTGHYLVEPKNWAEIQTGSLYWTIYFLVWASRLQQPSSFVPLDAMGLIN